MKQIKAKKVNRLIEQALNLKQKGELLKAEYDLKKALKIEPNNFIALNNLGNIFSVKNDLKKAEFFFSKAINIKQDYSN